MSKLKVAVGLSGGVDSAMTAAILKEKGYEVVGVHLYCWPPISEIEKDGMTRSEWIAKNGCRADDDRQDALKTALNLGIPFEVLDFSEEYKARVVDYFYREYEAGRTPNPDILCNSEIKFGLFLDWAIKNGYDKIATGHYARIEKKEDGEFGLFIPKDTKKDQTYFLYKLTAEQLERVEFPLGGYLKSEVRQMAEERGLPVAFKKDSQGICFVGDVDIKQFLKRRLEETPGNVLNTKGEVVGTHKGVWFYTIGQRGGWNLNAKAQKKYSGDGETPLLYVISKSAKDNTLVVGFGGETMKEEFALEEMSFVNGVIPSGTMKVRIRNTGDLLDCSFDGKKVTLNLGVRGIASGQSAVFYRDGECLGGGVIT